MMPLCAVCTYCETTVKADPEQVRREAQSRILARREAEKARAAKEAEERRQQEQEMMERLRAEEARRLQVEEEKQTAILRARAEAEQRAIEEKARSEKEARDAEFRRQELAEQDRAAKAAAQQNLQAWLHAHQLPDVRTKKSLGFFSGSAFPLHIAVMEKDVEIVNVLLASNADPTAVNSGKLTPFQLAGKLAKKSQTGAYDAVIRALQ